MNEISISGLRPIPCAQVANVEGQWPHAVTVKSSIMSFRDAESTARIHPGYLASNATYPSTLNRMLRRIATKTQPYDFLRITHTLYSGKTEKTLPVNP